MLKKKSRRKMAGPTFDYCSVLFIEFVVQIFSKIFSRLNNIYGNTTNIKNSVSNKLH